MEKPVNRYEKLKYIGEGQFATVHKAKDITTNKIVAVKKIKIKQQKENVGDDVTKTVLCEIKMLQKLHHENIIKLLDVIENKSNVKLIFDFMDTDLDKVIKNPKIVFTPANVKAFLKMILQGLEYLHSNYILHRDLKPNNLLINFNGVLKIADFGLARCFDSPSKLYTHQIATRWYRSPELLFGSRQYGTGVDIWSIGCIMAELLLREPFLPGKSDLDQLTKIFQIFGTPTENTWPGMKSLPDYMQFSNYSAVHLENVFLNSSNDLIDLVKRLFALCPTQRCMAPEALNMPYFSNQPEPVVMTNFSEETSFSSSRKRRSLKRRRLLDSMEISGTVPKKLSF